MRESVRRMRKHNRVDRVMTLRSGSDHDALFQLLGCVRSSPTVPRYVWFRALARAPDLRASIELCADSVRNREEEQSVDSRSAG
jgi:hypothetical protein